SASPKKNVTSRLSNTRSLYRPQMCTSHVDPTFGVSFPSPEVKIRFLTPLSLVMSSHFISLSPVGDCRALTTSALITVAQYEQLITNYTIKAVHVIQCIYMPKLFEKFPNTMFGSCTQQSLL